MEKEKTTATVKVGSTVVFTWPQGYHNVYLMPNKADYDACNFKNSEELAEGSLGPNTDKPFIYKASKPGVYYFGCEIGSGFHCETPQKLTLTVTGMLCALTTQRSNNFHTYDKLSRVIFCPSCVFVSQSCWHYFCRHFSTPQKIKLPFNTRV